MKSSDGCAVAITSAAVLAMFCDLLFSSGTEVISQRGRDISALFVYFRAFGFAELRQGNLALWNPYLFAGAPFFGAFQAALLYPPNWLYMALRLPSAINFGVALHVLLSGLFMYVWAAHRGLGSPGRLLSAMLLMFGAPNFLQLFAGHLPHQCTIAWAPLVFLAIDGLLNEPRLRWVLLGMGAIAMQILAGFPQYVVYTAVIATLYVVLRTVSEWWLTNGQRTVGGVRRMLPLGGLGIIYLGAACLTAVQLLSGIDAMLGSVRSRGVSLDFAASFSFPPENLLMLLAPAFFGDAMEDVYWGRWLFWEVCLFVGNGGLLLALVGATAGRRRDRCVDLLMVVLSMLLALGRYTPLFGFLYHWVPSFDRFRGIARFTYFAQLFLALLAGAGLDSILRPWRGSTHSEDALCRTQVERGSARVAFAGLLLALALVASATFIEDGFFTGKTSPLWPRIMEAGAADKSDLVAELSSDPQFVSSAAIRARNRLLIAAGTLALLSVLLFFSIHKPRLGILIALLAMMEVFVFARWFRPTFDLRDVRVAPEVSRFFAQNLGDYRVLWPEGGNKPMGVGVRSIWGSSPEVSLRYAQLLTYLQGDDPDQTDEYVTFRHLHPLYAMLRCKFLVLQADDKVEAPPPVFTGGGLSIYQLPEPLPRAFLVDNWRLISSRDEALVILGGPDFDPRVEVLLEDPPDFPMHSGDTTAALGHVDLLESTTNMLRLRAELSRPAVLVITDSYWTGWSARGEPGSSQDQYRVQPANYVVRGIPLSAGEHRITLEYSPTAFRVGAWVSIVSLALVSGVIVWLILRRRPRCTGSTSLT